MLSRAKYVKLCDDFALTKKNHLPALALNDAEAEAAEMEKAGFGSEALGEAALTAAYTEDMVCDGRPRCEAVCWRWHGMFGCADVVELLLLLLLLLQQRPRRPRLRSGCIRSASVSMRSTPG